MFLTIIINLELLTFKFRLETAINPQFILVKAVPFLKYCKQIYLFSKLALRYIIVNRPNDLLV